MFQIPPFLALPTALSANSSSQFKGFEVTNPEIDEVSAGWVFLFLKSYGLCPLQMMEAGPIMPKFSLRLTESTIGAGDQEGVRVTKVLWVHVNDDLSDDSNKNGIPEGAKGWAAAINFTGMTPNLDGVMKTQPIRVSVKEIASFTEIIEFFQINPSSVKIEETVRKQSGPNYDFVMEVLFFGKMRVFSSGNPGESLVAIVQKFHILFGDLVK